MRIDFFAAVFAGFDICLDLQQMLLRVFQSQKAIFVDGITFDASSPTTDDLLQFERYQHRRKRLIYERDIGKSRETVGGGRATTAINMLIQLVRQQASFALTVNMENELRIT